MSLRSSSRAALLAISALVLASPVRAAPASGKAKEKRPAAAPATTPATEPPRCPSVVNAQPAPLPEELRELVRRYSNARAATFFDVTTNGEQLLIGSRFGEARQLALVEALPLGMRQQLTFAGEPIDHARFLPQDPNQIFFLRSLPGKEDPQIFKLDRQHAQTVRLTDGKSRYGHLLLSRDGRRIAWSSNARAGSESDVWVAESDATALPRRLTSEPGRWRPIDFSPNGRALLVLHERSSSDAELFYIPVDGSEHRKLFPLDGTASVQQARFSADGHDLFLVTDKFADAEELIRIDPDHPDHPARRLTQELHWDVDALAAAQDRGAPAAAAIAVDQGGYDRLYLLEPGTLSLMPVSLPPGVVTVLQFPTTRSDVLYLGLSSPSRPSDIYRLDVRTRRLTRYTNSELGPVDPETLLEPQRVSWLSDGIEIPALIYRPKNDLGNKLPVVIMLQEGPLPLSRPRFNLTAQLLANELGIAVLTPGLRGTSGQGKKLLGDADPEKRAQQQLSDLSAALDWIAAQPDLDATKIALLGGENGLPKLAEAKFANRIKAALGADARGSGQTRADEEAQLGRTLQQLREKLLGYPPPK